MRAIEEEHIRERITDVGAGEGTGQCFIHRGVSAGNVRRDLQIWHVATCCR